MASLAYGALELLDYPYDVRLGTSFGAWQSVTTSTSSLFLDGATVAGDGTSNREVSLRVSVSGRDRAEVTSASEALLVEANKQTNTLTFTPDVGVPFVIETFRVKSPTRVDGEDEALPNMRVYELVLPALPFVRSTTRLTPEGLAADVFLDNFEGANNTRHYSTYYKTDFAELGSYALGGDDHLVIGSHTWTPVSNATVTSGPERYNGTLTAVSSGNPVAQTAIQTPTASFAAGQPVVVQCGVGPMATPRNINFEFEWISASNTVLATESVAVTADTVKTKMVTRWGGAPPAGAVQVRSRVTGVSFTAGQSVVFQPLDVAVAGVVADSVPPQVAPTPPLNGSMVGIVRVKRVSSFILVEDDFATSRSPVKTEMYASYLRRDFAQPVNLTKNGTPSYMSAAFHPALAYDGSWLVDPADAKLTIVDSAGATSTFMLTLPSTINAWKVLSSGDMTPSYTSGGGANLSDIRSYRLVVHTDCETINSADVLFYVDSVRAVVPVPGRVLTSRGTVFNLSGILGSAPAEAAGLAYGSTMTDLLMLSTQIDANPLLAVTSNATSIPAPAPHRGVFSLIGCVTPATALSNPQLTVTQKAGTTTVISKTLTGTQQAGNHYVDFGTLELPIAPVAPTNTQTNYTFTLTPSSTSWTELLLVDTDGSLLWIPSMTAATFVQVDEPTVATGIGAVWVGSQGDGSDWVSPTSPPIISKPLHVKAPSARLLVYSTAGAPDVRLSYYPRWLVEPTS